MLELSPYFKAISRQPHMCPRCGHRLELRPLELTWDRAVWRCGCCGWFQTVIAPKAAEMGQRDPSPQPAPAKPRHCGRIIEVDFGRVK